MDLDLWDCLGKLNFVLWQNRTDQIVGGHFGETDTVIWPNKQGRYDCLEDHLDHDLHCLPVYLHF